MNFSEALNAMKQGKIIKRKNSKYEYFLKNGIFYLSAKGDNLGDDSFFSGYGVSPEFSNDSAIVQMFERVVYTENFSYFDEDDLLANDWEIVDDKDRASTTRR